ncbi:MAG: hypothetical protein HRT36_06205 [Alphaproteobacteria bacterium]|nr:hypothetical protein [Alphaproteobacteria bacterium]
MSAEHETPIFLCVNPAMSLLQCYEGRGLLVVANRPYGILNGILLAWLDLRLDEDFRVIAIGILCPEPSLKPNILPINFDPRREATWKNVTSGRAALQYVRSGYVVEIFLVGAVLWAHRRCLAVENEDWKSVTGKLINTSGCDVLPVQFHGANSGLYQFVSRHLMSIRPDLYLRPFVENLQ